MNVLADGSDLLRRLHVALGHLGDVHQTLDSVAQLHEGAERDELGHATLDDGANGVLLDEHLPRILGGLLEAKGDALAVEIHVEDLDGNLVSDLDDLGRVVDVAPGQLGDVNESVDAAEVHKGTEVDDRRDRTLEDLTLGQVAQNGSPLVLAAFLEHHAARKDDVVAVAIHLDDTGLEALTHEAGKILDPAEIDERCRQEAAQADVEDESTLDDLDDFAVDVFAVVELGFDVDPGALVLGTLLGKDKTAILVLLLENQCLYLVAEGDDVAGICILANGKLAGRNNALRLVADVQQDFVPLDLHDGTGDEIAVIEVRHRVVDECVHLLIGVLNVLNDSAVLKLFHLWTPFCVGAPPIM